MNFIKKLLLFLFLIVIILAGIIVYLGYSSYSDAILETPIAEKLAILKEDENYISLDEISSDFKNAVVAIEDHRFYRHSGFDIISLGRAIVTNVQNKELSEGGSTITQQVAKNLYFTQQKLFTRKVAELFMAFSLEKELSKTDILEIYVNINFYGNRYYGIYEASQGYFKKDPKDLSLNESAMLAGIPNAPSVYAPNKNPALANQRKVQVLKAMLKHEYIIQEQYDKCVNNK